MTCTDLRRFAQFDLPGACGAGAVLHADDGRVARAKRPSPPSLVQAFHAAEANLRLIPGGDIESDFRRFGPLLPISMAMAVPRSCISTRPAIPAAASPKATLLR
jgi:hypothetical protein